MEYEKQNGKTRTAMKYNPLNFSDDAIQLDGAYPSTMGEVSIDWMMKSAAFGIPSGESWAGGVYVLEKGIWNMINGAKPNKNMWGTANSNGPRAYAKWIN